jgi:hypothetical protein
MRRQRDVGRFTVSPGKILPTFIVCETRPRGIRGELSTLTSVVASMHRTGFDVLTHLSLRRKVLDDAQSR